jgi:hypothetical protein
LLLTSIKNHWSYHLWKSFMQDPLMNVVVEIELIIHQVILTLYPLLNKEFKRMIQFSLCFIPMNLGRQFISNLTLKISELFQKILVIKQNELLGYSCISRMIQFNFRRCEMHSSSIKIPKYVSMWSSMRVTDLLLVMQMLLLVL